MAKPSLKTALPSVAARNLATRMIHGGKSQDEIVDLALDQFAREYIKILTRRAGGQKHVALEAGIEPSNFSKWLKGGKTLSPPNVYSVLMVLNITQDQLFDELTAREYLEEIKAELGVSSDGEVLSALRKRRRA